MAFDPITYTVKSGDSLYNIASKYNTTIDSIMVLNNLTTSNLNVGQTLKIPAYTEAIAKANGTLVYKGTATNTPILGRFAAGSKFPVIGASDGWYRVRLHNRAEGWVLKTAVNIKVYDGTKPIVEILGFYTLEEGPGLPSSFVSFDTNKNLMSEVDLFMYRINKDNPTDIEKFGTFSDNDVTTLVAIAHRNNVRILPVIHNLLYKPGGTTKSKDLVKAMTSTPQSRKAFINNVVKLVETFGFDGANIDIEDVYREDSANLSAFYTELGVELRRRGYILAASVPSRVSDQPFNPFSDPFDYTAIGKAVNEFGLMLYNEHGWPGSGPGPVVSIGWMNRVLTYTVTKVPRNKIFADVSVFGFDFNLTTNGIRYVTYDIAVATAKKYGKEIIFDQKTQTPMFDYTAENGDKHEVWFEDSRSIKAKIDLAYQFKINGVALWRLGLEDKNIWTMINNEVVVKR